MELHNCTSIQITYNIVIAAWRSYMHPPPERSLFAKMFQKQFPCWQETLSKKVTEPKSSFEFKCNETFWTIGGCILLPVLPKFNCFISWYFRGTPRMKELIMLLAERCEGCDTFVVKRTMHPVDKKLIALHFLSLSWWHSAASFTFYRVPFSVISKHT